MAAPIKPPPDRGPRRDHPGGRGQAHQRRRGGPRVDLLGLPRERRERRPARVRGGAHRHYRDGRGGPPSPSHGRPPAPRRVLRRLSRRARSRRRARAPGPAPGGGHLRWASPGGGGGAHLGPRDQHVLQRLLSRRHP